MSNQGRQTKDAKRSLERNDVVGLPHGNVWCITYAMVPDQRQTKLHAKGDMCLFLGYCEGTKAY